VHDLGGGTFDKSLNGKTFLVGEEFDIKLKQFLIGKIKKQYVIDNSKEKLAQQRIGKAVEKLKTLNFQRKKSRRFFLTIFLS
jgi:molecular chaperone DnaK (HSP70)